MKPRERGGIVDSLLNVYGVQGLKGTLRVRPTGTARAANDVRAVPLRAPPITYCTHHLPFGNSIRHIRARVPRTHIALSLAPCTPTQRSTGYRRHLPARLAQAVHERGAYRSEVVFYVLLLRVYDDGVFEARASIGLGNASDLSTFPQIRFFTFVILVPNSQHATSQLSSCMSAPRFLECMSRSTVVL